MEEFKNVFEEIFDLVPAYIFFKDKHNRFVRVNKVFADSMGIPKEKIEGKPMSELYSKEMAEKYGRDDNEVISTGVPKLGIIESFETESGEKRWVQTSKVPYRNQKGEIIGIVGFSIDITEQKNDQLKLKNSETQLKSIINTVVDPIFVKDREHRWVLLNDSFCKFMGYKLEDLVGKSDYDFFPKSEADIFWKKDEEVFKNKLDNVNEEAFTDYSGITHTIITKKSLYKNEKGDEFIVGIISDVTNIKKTADALKTSDEKLKAIVTAANDAIIMLDDKGMITFWNKAAEKIFGYSTEEVVGKDCHKLLAPERYHADSKKAYETFSKTGEGSAIGKTVELAGKKRDGSEFSIELSLSAIKIDNKWNAVGVLRDVTERKKYMNDLERFQKVTIGREKRIIELKNEIKRLKGEIKE